MGSHSIIPVNFPVDFERRFGGIARLYGSAGAARIAQAHVCVVGIGGVGSWTAESLARSGVGQLTLIDLDQVAESNLNRQIQALEDTLGMAKVDAMAQRIAQINPTCRVTCIEDFVGPENVAQIFATRFDWVVDASDQVLAKCAMLAHCAAHRQAIITLGAAGGKTDPTRIAVTDLSRTLQDPLLASVRARLRRHHGFPRGDKKFGLPSVYSSQPLIRPRLESPCAAPITNTNDPQSETAPAALQGLSCAGYGSAMHVTAVFGLCAAGYVLNQLADDGNVV
ncbi:MAG: tRNA threonylcarbamoyladenosine dehydratase [Burkholderiaceae bacterium]|nr:MAG: tRNA threonylcarbamoyladenosine dehydratase [Burkholderiaceae bacterium]